MSNKLATLKFEQIKAVKWRDVLIGILMPMVGILFFILLWHTAAPNINTSLGDFPQPKQVFEQWGNLVDEYNTEQEREAVQVAAQVGERVAAGGEATHVIVEVIEGVVDPVADELEHLGDFEGVEIAKLHVAAHRPRSLHAAVPG